MSLIKRGLSSPPGVNHPLWCVMSELGLPPTDPTDEAEFLPNQVRPSDVLIVGAVIKDYVIDGVRGVEGALIDAVRAAERARLADEKRAIMVETLLAARDAARADWRLVVGPPDSKEIYDENQARHFIGMAGWLKRRADKIAAGEEPDWPDSSGARLVEHPVEDGTE